MSMGKEEIETALEKKRGQVEKAEARLDVKKKRNRKLRDRRYAYETRVRDTQKIVDDLKRKIAYHENMIEGWEKKIREIPEEELLSDDQEKYDTVKEQLERMEMLAVEMTGLIDRIEREKYQPLIETYKTSLKSIEKQFKSEKGHGF